MASKQDEKRQRALSHLMAKRDKLGMLEELIAAWEVKPQTDEVVKYLRDLNKRANEVRQQLKVLSTTMTYDY